MEHSICRQQIIAKYFGDDESMNAICNTCDVCQKEEHPEQVRDCTQEAKDILECLTSMMVTQSRIKVSELVMTYMGSKAKDVLSKNFHMVPQYGIGKTSFKNISVATQFLHYMIFEGFLNENLHNVDARGSLTFVTHGNIATILAKTIDYTLIYLLPLTFPTVNSYRMTPLAPKTMLSLCQMH